MSVQNTDKKSFNKNNNKGPKRTEINFGSSEHLPEQPMQQASFNEIQQNEYLRRDTIESNKYWILALLIVSVVGGLYFFYTRDSTTPPTFIKKDLPQTVVFKTEAQLKTVQQKSVKFLQNMRISVDDKEFAALTEIKSEVILLGIDKDIQVGSYYDYLNLTSREQYKNMQANLHLAFPYEQYHFGYDETLQKVQQKIPISSNFDDNVSVIEYFLNQYNQSINFTIFNWSLITQTQINRQFGSILLQNLNSEAQKSQTFLEAQYLFLNNTYSIQNQQHPLCIFTYLTQQQLPMTLLSSLEQQNYTNFRIVIIVDPSTNTDLQKIYNSVNQLKNRIKNRVHIVYNLVELGQVGSLYFRVKQVCQDGEIVIMANLNDQFLTTQALKVISAQYDENKGKNMKIWMTYGSFSTSVNGNSLSSRVQLQQKVLPYNIRSKMELNRYFFNSFIKQVFEVAPLEYFIQYKYVNNSKFLYPKFYNISMFEITLPVIYQLSGKNRTQFVEIPVYHHFSQIKQIQQDCSTFIQMLQKQKPKLKTRMRVLPNLKSKPSKFREEPTSLFIKDAMAKSYESIARCQTEQKMRANPNINNDGSSDGSTQNGNNNGRK